MSISTDPNAIADLSAQAFWARPRDRARGRLRPPAPRAAGLVAAPAGGPPRRARGRADRRLLGAHPLRRHPRGLPRPAGLLLRQGRDGRGRPAGVPGHGDLDPRDGRPPPRRRPRADLVGVHPEAGAVARGRRAPRRPAGRRRAGPRRLGRLRHPCRQAPAAHDDHAGARRAGGGPRASRSPQRRDGLVGRPGVPAGPRSAGRRRRGPVALHQAYSELAEARRAHPTDDRRPSTAAARRPPRPRRARPSAATPRRAPGGPAGRPGRPPRRPR